MECCLADLRKICMEKLVDRALAELRHVFCFTSIANEFKEEKAWLASEIETLEQRAKVAAGRGNDIEAEKEKFENIELPRRLPDVERYSSKDYFPLQSRESKYEELLDALKDENNYMIGLHGMGGIGKTTLAKEVGKALKLSEQFSRVIFTTVSFTPDTKKIQDDIAGSLGLKWEDCNESDRPKKLWSRLTNGEKVLLIMDDVWDQGSPLDFDLIGIPTQGNHKGCRVLITTQSKRILNKMGCDKMIELELLTEDEAWTMFKMYAGIENSSSNNLITKGRKIAKECKQLPVAIAVIASSLRGQQDRQHEWDATLKSLKKPVSMDYVDDEMVGIYKCLKVSYDYMKNEKAKGLFLLSSVFPEDEQIPIEILARLGIGMGLFGEHYGRYDDARDEVAVAKSKLIDNCLLMEVGKEHVKMYDLVREVAQWIANKEIQSLNLSNKDQKSSLERKRNIKYLFCKGKDMDLFSSKYDGSKLEILIVDMEREEDCGITELPNSFFDNIVKLRVLYFLGHYNQTISLPHSIDSLANIRSILVDGIDLGDISVLGNLQTLETLDLVECKINELPHGIAKLGRFKLLKLDDCEIRRNDPFEVIERCSTLEELYFIDSFNYFCREITLPKLQRYRIKRGFWCTLDLSLSKYVCFRADDYDECFLSKETFKYCMQTSEGLELDSIKKGWRNLMPEIVPVDQGMENLVELRLRRISQLQCLIDTTGSQVPIVLSKLEKLYLYEMENLEELFHGSLSFDSLKNLEELSIEKCKMFRKLFNCHQNLCNLKTVTLVDCPMLVNLFPLFTSRSPVLLEKLTIYDCQGLENIVIDDGGNDDKSQGPMFPKLRDLSVVGCHRLESIFRFLSLQDFPVLEVIEIRSCDKLKYIFDQYQHVELSSLKEIKLGELPNFIGIFPEDSDWKSSHVNESSSTSRHGFEVQTQVDTIKRNIFSWSCICCHGNNYRQKLGNVSTTKVPSAHEDPLQNKSTASVSSLQHLQIWEHAQCFPVPWRIMCNIKVIKLSYISKIKYLFNLSITPRILVETLTIWSCDELKQIIDIGDDESGGNNLGDVFPKLKTLDVYNCRQLEYIFGPYTDNHHTNIHLHLPELEDLNLSHLPNLVAMCPKQYSTTFPPLKKFKLEECPKVDSESLDNTVVRKDLYQKNRDVTPLHFQLREPALCLPIQSNTSNMKDLKLSGNSKIKYVFSLSNTQNMLLETLRIENCEELKYIIVDIEDDKNVGNNWVNVFPKLKTLSVKDCRQLKYIFGHYSDGHLNHNEIRLQLPALQCLELCNLPSLVSICPKQYSAPFPQLKELKLKECSLDNTFMKFLYIWERGQCLPLRANISCNVKEMTLSGFSKIKSVFSLSYTSRMLVEILRIENCDELKHIIVDIGYGDYDGNDWGNVFPKLKRLSVKDCRQLKYIFGHYNDDHQSHNEVHLHLPALQCLQLCNLSSLVAMCPKQYRTTFSPLKELELVKCSLDKTIFKELSGSMEHFIALESLNDMMGIFVGPKNSFSLQNLTKVKIVGCEILEIVFSNSISTCLSQLTWLIIKECKELKHIIEDDTSNSLASRTLFPKLKALVVIKCHKLKCVFPISICKEFPELETLMISEANELEEIFKREGDQKVEIPNLNIVVFVDLPSLFHAQEIHFRVTKNRLVENCQKFPLTPASVPYIISWVDSYFPDFQNSKHFKSPFQQSEDETKGYDTGNENQSAETTKDIVVSDEIEVEAALGHKLTSSQIKRKQTPKELEKEQQTSQQGLINQQDPLGEIDNSVKPFQSVEEGTASTNAKTITPSTHSELVSSSQVSVQDVRGRDSLETTKINDDRGSLNEDVVMKERPIIEEQFSKDDEFTVLKSKPSPSNSVPMPLAFQAPSMHFEGNSSQKVEDLSSHNHITQKLEELVFKKHLDYENLSLLRDFLVKHPSVLLSDKLSNAYKGYAYKFLTKLLKFLQTHSVLDVLGSSHSEFVELLHDVRSFSFDKDWLDGVEKRALFPDLKFSQEALQNLLDSKKQITENVEELKQKLESIIQQEKEIVESKAALSAPLGY